MPNRVLLRRAVEAEKHAEHLEAQLEDLRADMRRLLSINSILEHVISNAMRSFRSSPPTSSSSPTVEELETVFSTLDVPSTGVEEKLY